MNRTAIKYLTLSQEDLIDAGAFDFRLAIDALKKSLFCLGKDAFCSRTRSCRSSKKKRRAHQLPAATLLDDKICGVKWVSVFPPNPRRFGVQNLSAIIVLSEIEKGFPVCVMDGTLCSNIRVAAMGATAAEVLARKDAETHRLYRRQVSRQKCTFWA